MNGTDRHQLQKMMQSKRARAGHLEADMEREINEHQL
jgi:hypothetical protein